jgi:hypothetical protein
VVYVKKGVTIIYPSADDSEFDITR